MNSKEQSFGVHDNELERLFWKKKISFFPSFQPQRFGALPIAVQHILQAEISIHRSNAWKTTSDIPVAIVSSVACSGDTGLDATS